MASRQRVEQHLKASADDTDRVVAALLAGDAAAAAKIAQLSSNATAYGMALGSCARDASAACGLLSAARWAQLDAGNAAPWLLMASAALQCGDEAGLAEGLHRASLATTMDVGFGRMAGRVVAALPQIAADPAWPVAAVNANVLVAVIGQEAAVAIPSYSAVNRGCSAAALRDSNRQQLCRATARMMVKHGRTLLDIGIGLGLAKRTGIPDTELPVTSAELDAGMKWMAEVQPGPPEQAFSCEAFARLPKYFASVAQRGEWGAVQDVMRASQAAASAAAVTKP
ncbi:hypothetical protein BH11PSE10_BH11PSE10_06400 [soil metagenome]